MNRFGDLDPAQRLAFCRGDLEVDRDLRTLQEEVNFDVHRMEMAIAGCRVKLPDGLSGAEFKAFMRGAAAAFKAMGQVGEGR